MRIKWLHDIAVRLGLASAVVLVLASCGAVSGTPAAVVTTDLEVFPAIADLFPDLPTQFFISGGKPGYLVFSSNNLVLPLDSTVTGSTFFAVPGNVTADTPITITVRDADGKTKGVNVTVRPVTINNDFTFTIQSPSGAACGTNALCSGGTAQVVATATLNGIALTNRSIRFDVFQGDFQLVTPATGALVNSLTVISDERGEALVRLTAAASAPPQVATLIATDTTTGLVRRFNFNIVTTALSTLPSANVTFEGGKGLPGMTEGFCPIGGRVDFYIFGGTPPYTVAALLPNLVFVSPDVVTASGGRTMATLNGCGQTPLLVTDATQKAIETALLIGVKGPAGDAITPPSTFTVSPKALSVSCGGSGTVNVTGGTGSFTTSIVTAGAPSSAFAVTQDAITITFTRIDGILASPTSVASSPITVNVADGSTVIAVDVTVPLNCPSPPITASPSSVTLAASTSRNVAIAGGTAPYNVSTSNASVATATVTGNTVTVTGVANGLASITVTDSVGSAPATIQVTVSSVAGLSITATPSSVNLPASTSRNVAISGGTAPYNVSTSNSTVATATVSGNTVTVTGVASGSASITVTDSVGSAPATISVTVTPAPAVTAFPSSVTVNSSVPSATSTIFGGTPPYTVASSDTTRVGVSLSGTTVTITRVGTATSGSATIFIRDSLGNVGTIAVTIN